MKIKRVLVAALAAALAGVGAATISGTPAQAAAGCEVSYNATSWTGGFYAGVRIKNLGDPWTSYTVSFRFTGDQRITQAWNLRWTQSGAQVTAAGGSWDRPIGTGESLHLGFNGTYTGVNNPPVDWSVNGIRCVIAGQPPAVIAEPEAVSVPEGGSGTFTVRLSHPPTGTVRIDMRSTGTGIWGAPPVVLTFDENNWSTPRPFTMYSMADADAVHDFVIVNLSATGYAADTVTLTQVDDD
ncbi:cellulose binding domain-containing protein [Micromonospora sp. CPCC 206061]|uniref:cellulose binding domain-containing protein n=1 Tax=Micromonospora sp. CPCC 206061 TaxID=3122410 RepID=UPI002FEEE6BC